MQALSSYGPLAGRILISILFILSGFGKLTNFAGSVQYAAAGVPESLATLAIIVAIVVELGGGFMLLLGYKIKWVVLTVAGYTLLAALLFHNFWTFEGMDAQNQMVHFMKNLAIVGGLLYVAVFGAGSISIDKRKKISVSPQE